MPRVLTVIPTLRDYPSVTDDLAQERDVEIVVAIVSSSRVLYEFLSRHGKSSAMIFYVEPSLREHVGVRVGKAINYALRHFDLRDFDYLLKIDADVRLPPGYIKRCILLNADLVGMGPFMLVKTEPFLKYLDGKWPQTSADDAYIKLKFQSLGLKVYGELPGLVENRRRGGGDWRYYYFRGIDDYRMGIDPILEAIIVLRLVRGRRRLLPLFTLLGYVAALVAGEERYDFAPFVLKRLSLPSLEYIIGKLLSAGVGRRQGSSTK